MSDFRPKDNIRLLLSVWTDELEKKAKAKALEHARRMELPETFRVTQFDIDMDLVRRVRAFLEEHPR